MSLGFGDFDATCLKKDSISVDITFKTMKTSSKKGFKYSIVRFSQKGHEKRQLTKAGSKHKVMNQRL